MEFITTSRYRQAKFDKPIVFESLKKLAKIKVSQKLEPLDSPGNLNLLDQYAAEGMKIVPIARTSSKDRSRRTEFPNRVLLELTSRCNLTCRMCPRHNLTRPHIDFDKALYLKVVDELDQHGIEGIWLFHLGEPILHPNWKEIVTYVGSKKNIDMIWFSSNGVKFDQASADFVLDSNITFMNYSLHGTNAETFGVVSPPKLYATVRENLEYMLRRKKELGRGPTIHIQMIDQEGTHDNIDEFLETFYETGEIVSINTLEYANLPNNTYGLARERAQVSSCKRISRGDCFIVSNGDIQPCDATYNSEILLGNVQDQSVSAIWNGEVRRTMVDLNAKGELYKNEYCSKCTDFDL